MNTFSSIVVLTSLKHGVRFWLVGRDYCHRYVTQGLPRLCLNWPVVLTSPSPKAQVCKLANLRTAAEFKGHSRKHNKYLPTSQKRIPCLSDIDNHPLTPAIQTYTNPATPGGSGYDNPATPSPLIAESPQSSGSSHFSGSRYGTTTPMYTDYMTPSPGTISPLTPGSDFSPRTPGSPMDSGGNMHTDIHNYVFYDALSHSLSFSLFSLSLQLQMICCLLILKW